MADPNKQPRVRGVLLRGWAEFVTVRFGAPVARAIAEMHPEITGVSEPLAWYPASWQLRITEEILNRGCDGDEAAAIDSLIDYGMGTADSMAIRAAKWLGPKRVFGLAPKIHPYIYSVGACESEPSRGVATLRWTGSELFDDTVWQLLQRAASVGVLRACGRNGTAETGVHGSNSYALTVRW